MKRKITSLIVLAALGGWIGINAGTAHACPFCSAVSLTFAQEMKAADLVVIAELTELPPKPPGADGAFAPGLGEPLTKSKFKILNVLKGQDSLKGVKQIDAVYLGDKGVGSQFLITGVDPKAPAWATPIALTERSRKYIDSLPNLPETGAGRLVFFQDYLEDADEMLKSDAYDEFAQAPYADIKEFGPRVNYSQLIKWLHNPDISPSHRRLYFTLLGVCGTEKDVPLIESIFKSKDPKDRKLKAGLDATIGAYLAIKGPAGLELIEKTYLQDPDAEFTDTYAAIQAIRIAQETGIVAKDKAAEAFHYMLDRPKMADLVIPDLARWQDWGVVDRLVQLFVSADADSAWVRVPVLRYLQVCPKPEAKKELARLEMLDPSAAKQAKSLFLPGGAPVPAEKPTTPASSDNSKTSSGGAATSNAKPANGSKSTSATSAAINSASTASGVKGR